MMEEAAHLPDAKFSWLWFCVRNTNKSLTSILIFGGATCADAPKLTGDKLATAAVAGLLLTLEEHPRLATVFWLAAAHAAAWGQLPSGPHSDQIPECHVLMTTM